MYKAIIEPYNISMEENYNFSTGGTTRSDITVLEEGHWYDGIVNLWNKSKGWLALVGLGAIVGLIIRIIEALVV